jgi:hypothetical protein
MTSPSSDPCEALLAQITLKTMQAGLSGDLPL